MTRPGAIAITESYQGKCRIDTIRPHLFIDYAEASDMVNRNKLCEILALEELPQYLIRAIQSRYVETNITMENGGRRRQKTILKLKEYDKSVHCHQCLDHGMARH
jgi:hypothetical protein